MRCVVGLLVASAVSCGLARSAHADMTAAWTAAQTHVPSTTAVAIAIDTGALAKSPVFGRVLPFVLGTQRDIGKGLDLVKQTCQLDPTKVLAGVVAASNADQTQGAIFLQLDGLDQTTAMPCIEKLSRIVLGARLDQKLVVRKELAAGKTTLLELSIDTAQADQLARRASDKERDRLYVAWVGKNVLAIPLDIDDRALFRKWLDNRGSFKLGKLGRALATLDKRAAIYAGSNVAAHLETAFEMKVGVASLTLGKTNVLARLRVGVESPAAATAAVNRVNVQLKSLIDRGRLSKNVEAILKSVMISDQRSELVIEASVPEANVLELLIALWS